MDLPNERGAQAKKKTKKGERKGERDEGMGPIESVGGGVRFSCCTRCSHEDFACACLRPRACVAGGCCDLSTGRNLR